MNLPGITGGPIAWTAVRNDYFGKLAPPDMRGAAQVVEQAISGGASVSEIVREVLSPAQVEVGRLWQVNEWSVADEHAASAVTEAALMAAAASPSLTERRAAGMIVLACAAGEWHTLPLRMVSEVLGAAGFETVFLGASVPPPHLRSFLEKNRPVALALNCSHALSLEGARESIEAAHATGTPVLVGGRGFGTNGQRARLVGADQWCDDPSQAVEILRAWAANSPDEFATAAAKRADRPSAGELLRVRETSAATLLRQYPELSSYTPAQWERTHEDFDSIVEYTLLAERLDDEGILVDFIAWLTAVLTVRHVPASILQSGLDAIADALALTRPAASALLQRTRVEGPAPRDPGLA